MTKAEVAQPTNLEKVETVVSAWFNTHIANTAVSRSEESYKAACAAKEELVKMLLEGLF